MTGINDGMMRLILNIHTNIFVNGVGNIRSNSSPRPTQLQITTTTPSFGLLTLYRFDRWAVRWMDSIYLGIKELIYEVIEVKSHGTISSKDISRRQLLKSSDFLCFGTIAFHFFFDALDVFDIARDIRDLEHPYSLEQLSFLLEEYITRYAKPEGYEVTNFVF